VTRTYNLGRIVGCAVVFLCAALLATAGLLKALPALKRQMAYNEIWCAAIQNRPQDLRTALEDGGDPNARNPADEPALMVAAHNGNVDCVRLLLKFGADPNIKGSSHATPLLHALRNSQDAIVADLLKHGADPNLSSDTDTPLTMAAWVGDANNVHQLLTIGANPNKHSPNGLSPLKVAIKEHYEPIVTMLGQAGAHE